MGHKGAVGGRHVIALVFHQLAASHSQKKGAEAVDGSRTRNQQASPIFDVPLQPADHVDRHLVLLRGDDHGEVVQALLQSPLVQNIDAVVVLQKAEGGALDRGHVDAAADVASSPTAGMMLGVEDGDLGNGFGPLAEGAAALDEAADLAQTLDAPGNQLAVAQAGGFVDLHRATQGGDYGRLLLEHLRRLEGPRRGGVAHAAGRVETPDHDIPGLAAGGDEAGLAAAPVQAEDPGVVAADPVGGDPGLAGVLEGL